MSFQVMLQQLTVGFGQTLLIFCLTLLFSLPLGMVVYFGRVSRFKPLSWIIKAYISIMRGTPLMLQLMVIYFGPYYIFGLQISSSWKNLAAAIGFVLNYAAYFAEIYRGGIESISAGQYEAAKILGYSKAQTFFRIILPQVIKRILPPMGNEIITLVKDTSLANTIANKEIIMMAKEYSAKGLIWPLFSTALFFLVFVGALTILFNWAEKKLDYFRC